MVESSSISNDRPGQAGRCGCAAFAARLRDGDCPDLSGFDDRVAAKGAIA
jgi:hypothetical protein